MANKKEEYKCCVCDVIFMRYSCMVANPDTVCCSKKCASARQKISRRGEGNPNYRKGEFCGKSKCECGRNKSIKLNKCAKCTRDDIDKRLEEFKIKVKNSSNISEISRFFSMSPGTFRKIVREYKIDTSHFISYANKELKTEEIFYINSGKSNSVIKRHILKYKLLPYLCFECGLSPNWNNKELTLQLDHINGNRNDNRLENFRFLCPNCHSQASTSFGRKAKGTGRLVVRTEENKKHIIEKIKTHNKNGLCLTTNAISNYDGFLYREAKHIFGSWGKAVEAAGFNYSDIKLLQGWSKDRVVKEIKEIVLINPKISFEEIKSINSKLHDAARRYFGGLRKVFIEIGFDYKTHRRKK